MFGTVCDPVTPNIKVGTLAAADKPVPPLATGNTPVTFDVRSTALLAIFAVDTLQSGGTVVCTALAK